MSGRRRASTDRVASRGDSPRLAYAALLALAALDAAGYGVIAPVVPAIADQTGAGPGVVGLLVASFAVGQLAGYPLGGRGVRRRHASFVLTVSLALVAAGDLGFVLGDDLAVYFPARFVQGLGAAGLWLGVAFGVLERFPGQEYARLTGILAAYSLGGIAGPALGAVGGIRGPFLAHLALVVAGGLVLLALGAPRERPAFGRDRAAVRTGAFWLSSAGVLLVALGFGTLEGPLPLHFAERLEQAEIAALFVAGSVVVGTTAALAGRLSPRRALAAGTLPVTAGVAFAGIADAVPLWFAAVGVAAVGFGLAEAGSLGVLLESAGSERIVFAMVVWSEVWAAGYLAGPAAAGAAVEALGFAAVGLVPLVAAAAVLAALASTARRDVAAA